MTTKTNLKAVETKLRHEAETQGERPAVEAVKAGMPKSLARDMLSDAIFAHCADAKIPDADAKRIADGVLAKFDADTRGTAEVPAFDDSDDSDDELQSAAV